MASLKADNPAPKKTACITCFGIFSLTSSKRTLPEATKSFVARRFFRFEDDLLITGLLFV